MPASRKTPQRIALMLKMHREGASAREIGGALGISHVAAAQWLTSSNLVPNGGHGSKKKRVRRELSPTDEIIAGAQQSVAEIEDDIPLDQVGALAHLTKRLHEVSAITNAYSAAGRKAGSVLMGDLDKAIKLEQALCTQIAALAPAKPPDPENDPSNVQAAAEVEGKIMRLADAARKNAKCCNCGKNPFGKVG
jgi:hypothetical protein